MTRTGLIAFAILIVVTILFCALLPGTVRPKFESLATATKEQLASTCSDPDLHFIGLLGEEAEVDSGVRVKLSPEYRSHKNRPEDLRQGRVVALLQLTKGAAFAPLGLTNNRPACWIVSGKHPDSLVTTIVTRTGDTLRAGIPTLAHPKHHWRPEAHWQADTSSTALLDVGPARLYAAVKQEFKAYSQTSCTNRSCCIPVYPKMIRSEEPTQ
jgi:hypothetical protein